MRKWWKCLRFGILHVNVLILLMESSWSCWTLWTLSVYGPSLSHLPACKLKIEHRWSSPIWWKSHWVQCPQGPATQMTPLCYNEDSTLKTDHSPMLIDRVRKIESLWLYAMASVIHPQLSIVMIILYTHLLHESQKGFKCTKVIK